MASASRIGAGTPSEDPMAKPARRGPTIWLAATAALNHPKAASIWQTVTNLAIAD
ncbi:hypothetical protein AAIH32_21340 [Pseudarthrobacter oxydans]|uniref:hypothetical protein n=1 Tax=Pseudarthrobacter oxydans TaxID=1671 RepID=UPI003D2DED2C